MKFSHTSNFCAELVHGQLVAQKYLFFMQLNTGAVTENPEFYFNLRKKKLLFTFAKKMLSLKGKNSGAMSWLSAAQQRK